MVLQNYERDQYGNVTGAPIRAVVYSNGATYTQPVLAYVAERDRPAECYGGDARAVFDDSSDTFFATALGLSAGGFDSYCIGAGGEGDETPARFWKWSRIYWNGHSGDGAHIAVTQGEVLLIGAGDVLHCDKYAITHGLPNKAGTTNPACYWTPVGMDQAIPAVNKNGMSAVGYWVGVSGSQLEVGYSDGSPAQAVTGGDIGGYMASTVARTPGVTEPIGFEFRNAIYNVQSDLLWVGVQGQCQTSGNHVCMGVIEILLHPSPVYWGYYQFDSPYNVTDGFLGGITVDKDGYVMATWVASGPTISDAMAVGGFAPDQQGYHYLTAYGNWRIIYGAQGTGGIDRPDYTEIDAIPGSNTVIAHGLHKVGGNFVSDLSTFNHCCNPRTGCPRNGCP